MGRRAGRKTSTLGMPRRRPREVRAASSDIETKKECAADVELAPFLHATLSVSTNAKIATTS